MIASLIAAAVMAPSSGLAGILNPDQFSSLGTLSLASSSPVTYVITGTSLIIGTTTYTGQLYQGIVVFDFSSINIGGNVTLSGSGSVPIALLSQTTAVISGQINVSANATVAGPGASNIAVGGMGGFIMGSPTNTISGSGGGGFGGSGGNGGSNGTLAGGMGGSAAFVDLNNTFEGGSRGGGLTNPNQGGGGGGAIEISAIQNITIGVGGSINAVGGNGALYGGGGSGGGILLGASSVFNYGTLDADGGAGAPGNASGLGQFPGSGGGGGGIIEALFTGSGPGSYIPGTQEISGGAAGLNGGQAGQVGAELFNNSYPFSVPEPPSLILLGTSTLGLLAVARVRRSLDRRAAPHL